MKQNKYKYRFELSTLLITLFILIVAVLGTMNLENNIDFCKSKGFKGYTDIDSGQMCYNIVGFDSTTGKDIYNYTRMRDLR